MRYNEVTREYEILFFILQIFFIKQGLSLQMLTDAQFHVLNPSESIKLECSFREDDYNLFDYPIIWRKQQLQEEVQVNVMGSLNEPFVSSSRFSVAFTPTKPDYTFELNIQDLRREDSGNYTCDVRGPRSMLLGYVTHQLFVRAPIERLFLLDGTIRDDTGIINLSSPTRIHMIEGRPARLSCVCLGGYPPPSLQLNIGARDVTRLFTFKNEVIGRSASTNQIKEFENDAPIGTGWGRKAEYSTAYLSKSRNDDLGSWSPNKEDGLVVADRLGLRVMMYKTVRYVENYQPNEDDNGMLLSCATQVPGLGVIKEISHLDVDYMPKISCRRTESSLGDSNVNIICEVRAKPGIGSLYWLIDKSTKLSSGETVGKFTVKYKDRLEDSNRAVLTDTTLVIGHITEAEFRTYTLIAQNGVGESSRDVMLYQKDRSTVQPLFGGQRQLASGSHVKNRDTSRDQRDQSYASGATSIKIRSAYLHILTPFFLHKLTQLFSLRTRTVKLKI